ncbi:DUF1003 domain-containing protein [Corynebacterium sp. TAE3-ERU12]|uniref:DUF1003 domain-containing protein n=1 Tax=Corynebacterium sp. TAE3-ERU12 TaxID=2849491 RepID=UPI001C46BCD9|nr:DUF1003 domain-containing protein [Corynebacterium sp. TAE3-ERU12]MBV7295067.1 DUF1003 domain-containing protein [Corynebacterium sp. TAE3-ERU12]
MSRREERSQSRDERREHSGRIDLGTPVTQRRRSFFTFDGDRFAEGAEAVARFLGTGKYLAYQTAVVLVWIALNIGGMKWNWDPYPFILLNLMFSTQAAYAAPLILLAQNRQEDRDRAAIAEDRRRAANTKADTEFLAREIAGVRAQVGESVTRDYLRRELEDLTRVLDRIEARLYEADERGPEPDDRR